MNIIYVILLSILSAILYRLGGSSKEDQNKEFPWIPKWIKSFPKKRDVGCNLCTIAGCLILGINAPIWAWVLSFGLMWASLSSYWDWMFGYDNHWFHMFMIGFSMLPIMFFSFPLELGIRCIILALLGGGWSKYTGNATWEELGRGVLLPLSLLTILI